MRVKISRHIVKVLPREREMWSKETKGLNFGFKHVTELLCSEHYYLYYNIVIICYIVIIVIIIIYITILLVEKNIQHICA